jgi:hypothetical protein
VIGCDWLLNQLWNDVRHKLLAPNAQNQGPRWVELVLVRLCEYHPERLCRFCAQKFPRSYLSKHQGAWEKNIWFGVCIRDSILQDRQDLIKVNFSVARD